MKIHIRYILTGCQRSDCPSSRSESDPKYVTLPSLSSLVVVWTRSLDIFDTQIHSFILVCLRANYFLLFFLFLTLVRFVLDSKLTLRLCGSSPASLASLPQSRRHTTPKSSMAASVSAEGCLSVCRLSRVWHRLQQPGDPEFRTAGWIALSVSVVLTLRNFTPYLKWKIRWQIKSSCQTKSIG